MTPFYEMPLCIKVNISVTFLCTNSLCLNIVENENLQKGGRKMLVKLNLNSFKVKY